MPWQGREHGGSMNEEHGHQVQRFTIDISGITKNHQKQLAQLAQKLALCRLESCGYPSTWFWAVNVLGKSVRSWCAERKGRAEGRENPACEQSLPPRGPISPPPHPSTPVFHQKPRIKSWGTSAHPSCLSTFLTCGAPYSWLLAQSLGDPGRQRRKLERNQSPKFVATPRSSFYSATCLQPTESS